MAKARAPGLTTVAQAATFLATVKIALRYGPSKTLPLASLHAAVAKLDEPEDEAQRRAAILTNALIADGRAIETNAIADRVAIIDAAMAPALVALIRRGQPPEPSDLAERALGYIANAERPTAGQVRGFLGAPKAWPNPADDALAELQRLTLIDRGAAAVPSSGFAYLPKDGIPYRVFDRAHPAIVKAAAKLAVPAAAVAFVGDYLVGAKLASRKKLGSMFKLLLSRPELDAALATLVARRRIALDKDAITAR